MTNDADDRTLQLLTFNATQHETREMFRATDGDGEWADEARIEGNGSVACATTCCLDQTLAVNLTSTRRSITRPCQLPNGGQISIEIWSGTLYCLACDHAFGEIEVNHVSGNR